MGMYLNPGNMGFRQIVNGAYVDKTGMIDFVNSSLDTMDRLLCVSRPRRFGKSFAARMLCAYYDRSCDSRELFAGLNIGKTASFGKFLNQFDVIYLDITRFLSIATDARRIVPDIQTEVIQELREAYSENVRADESILANAMF